MVRQYRRDIHILGGFRGCLSTTLAWRSLKKEPGALIATIAERPRFEGSVVSSVFAPLWYRMFFFMYGRKFRAVLAMGELGEQVYNQLGIREEVLFPYIYQVNLPEKMQPFKVEVAADCKDFVSAKVRFVYVGSFGYRKGVDFIIETFDLLPGNWFLDWIGTGGELESEVKAFARNKQVRFIGPIPSDQIIGCIENYDVCLVPSRFDGWGAVTNEALLAGIGVVVSDAVGSRDLVSASGAGKVFAAGNVNALSEVLHSIIENPGQIAVWKAKARAYRDNISAEAVSKYLKEVLSYVFTDKLKKRPVAPWLKV